jgi:hypothetical protein
MMVKGGLTGMGVGENTLRGMQETGIKMLPPTFILNETEWDDGYSRYQEQTVCSESGGFLGLPIMSWR